MDSNTKEKEALSARYLSVLKHKGYSSYRFAKENKEVTQSKLSHISTGRNAPSKSLIDVLLKTFPDVSKSWLVLGEGEMLIDKTPPTEITLSENKKGIPYYDVDFMASFLEIENNQATIPDSYINHPFFSGCDFVVRNSGQSMAKLIAHGDSIGLIQIKDWIDFLPFGEVYAIVTSNNLRLIKVITKGDNDDSFTLISKPTDAKKDEFPPQQIKKENILHIFKVQASSHLF